jgi:hypothetical protein
MASHESVNLFLPKKLTIPNFSHLSIFNGTVPNDMDVVYLGKGLGKNHPERNLLESEVWYAGPMF